MNSRVCNRFKQKWYLLLTACYEPTRKVREVYCISYFTTRFCIANQKENMCAMRSDLWHCERVEDMGTKGWWFGNECVCSICSVAWQLWIRGFQWNIINEQLLLATLVKQYLLYQVALTVNQLHDNRAGGARRLFVFIIKNNVFNNTHIVFLSSIHVTGHDMTISSTNMLQQTKYWFR